MEQNKIDNLMNKLENKEFEQLWMILEMHGEYSSDIDEETENEFLDKFAKLMEDLDWQYFKSEYRTNHFYTLILSHSTDVTEMKQCIENRRELNLARYQIAELIEATHDLNYIKQCIINKEELGLNTDQTVLIILGTYDGEYIKQCIENRDNLKIDTFQLVDLIIATNDKEYMKKCIEESSNLGLDSNQIIELIQEINDQEYTKKCIENRSKLGLSKYLIISLIDSVNDIKYIEQCIANREELNLSIYQIVDLIKQTQDSEYIKRWIENRKKLGLSNIQTLELIIATRDSEYIKQWVYNSEELNLATNQILELISKINDPECIKQFIENRETIGLYGFQIVSLIIQTNDMEYIKQCIEDREKFGLNNQEIKELIEATNDSQYIKQCINNYKKFNLLSNQIMELIKILNDPEYTKQCIENRINLGLYTDQIVKLIILLNNPEYTKHCIENSEKLGLSPSQVVKLIIKTDDREYIKQKFINKGNTGYTSEIILPEEMSIGIEIESIGEAADILRNSRVIFEDWKSKWDASLISDKTSESGIEIISPILLGANKERTEQIRNIGSLLTNCGQYVNNSCGGHIHIGANFLKSSDAYKNLLELWGNTEKILYLICNESGEIPRLGIDEFASPISGEYEKALSDGTISLEDENDLLGFKQKIAGFQNTRYKGINFLNLTTSSKGTIEFRLSNGTLNPDTWIDNINLFGGIIKASQQIADIQAKYNMSEEEKIILESFEKLKSTDISEQEKLELLLKIVMPPNLRKIYADRYKVNKKLVQENPDVSNAINKKTSHKAIRISKTQIGKQVFTGNEPITGEEAYRAEHIINQLINSRESMEYNI